MERDVATKAEDLPREPVDADAVDRAEPILRDRRGHVTMLGIANALFGVWLIASPWAIDFTVADEPGVPIAAGAVIVTVSLVRAFGGQAATWLGAINAMAGAACVLAGLLFEDSPAARWSTAVTGAIVLMLSLVSFAIGAERGRAPERPTTY